jgi:hypothetical protein
MSKYIRHRNALFLLELPNVGEQGRTMYWRKGILQLQKAGISMTSGEALLERMLTKIDTLCAERDRLKADLPRPRHVLGGRSW